MFYLTEPQFKEKPVEKKLDNTVIGEMMNKSHQEQLQYYDENRVGGRTRKFKMKR
jgi:hypothetical protein